jgi:3-hydroxyisobutyrate dehydrogenase
MSKITFLGLGAMGSRMAINLIKAGHEVTVWNRTATAASSVVAAGARQADTPKHAAQGADFVIAMVRDDEASRQVWLDPDTGALTGMAKGAVGIESSTLSPDWVRALGDATANRGIALLEAPVSGSRVQAETAKLVYLVGGEESTLKKAEPVLNAMGSAIHHVGPLGTGALVKLSTNTLLGIQVVAFAEVIGMLKRTGADAHRAMEAIASTSVWSPVATYLSGSMLSGNFAPQFPVELIEKDFGYTVEAAGENFAPTIGAARRVFRKAIEEGLGESNMTGVVQLFTQA